MADEEEKDEKNQGIDTSDAVEDADKQPKEKIPAPDGDSGEKSKGGDEEAKKKQSREDNAKFAELRRAEKARQRELEQVRKDAEFNVRKGLVAADTKAALGIDEISTPDEMYLADAYEKALKDGDENPTASAYKSLRKLQSDREAEKKGEEAKRNAYLSELGKEQADFEKEFKLKAVDVFNDKDSEFMKAFGGIISVEDPKPGTLTACYRAYTAMKKEEDEAIKNAAKSKGVPKTSDEGGEGSGEKDPTKMTHDEFAKYWNSRFS